MILQVSLKKGRMGKVRWSQTKFLSQIIVNRKMQCQPQIKKASAILQTAKFIFNRGNSLNSWHPDGPSRWSLLEGTKRKIQKSLACCSRRNLISGPLETAGLTLHFRQGTQWEDSFPWTHINLHDASCDIFGLFFVDFIKEIILFLCWRPSLPSKMPHIVLTHSLKRGYSSN